jgi:hypothetical protein
MLSDGSFCWSCVVEKEVDLVVTATFVVVGLDGGSMVPGVAPARVVDLRAVYEAG